MLVKTDRGEQVKKRGMEKRLECGREEKRRIERAKERERERNGHCICKC